MDLKSFTQAIEQIAEEKGIAKGKVIETIEMAIAAAYKKDYGKKGQIIRAKLDPKTGKAQITQIKIVVDESMIKTEEELAKEKEEREVEGRSMREREDEEVGEGKKVRFNPEKHIMLDEAKKINRELKSGDTLETILETHEDFGRIAAQTAKQVIIQRLREAEREAVFSEFKSKEGQLVSGLVQRVEGRTIFFDLGRAIGVMPPQETIPREEYQIGSRYRLYLVSIEDTPKGPMIYLSRSHPKMLSRLFELEVPEIASGTVLIKSIAREAGSRTKIAVVSTEEGIDPIGSCVGQRGTRVTTVINELGGEKIDVISWSEDEREFIGNALSPAKVIDVEIDKDKNQAITLVPEEQLSLAIGKEGQNVRLAAKLTGWKIDVRSPRKVQEKDEAKTPKDEEHSGGEKGETIEGALEKKKTTKKKTVKKKKTETTPPESSPATQEGETADTPTPDIPGEGSSEIL